MIFSCNWLIKFHVCFHDLLMKFAIRFCELLTKFTIFFLDSLPKLVFFSANDWQNLQFSCAIVWWDSQFFFVMEDVDYFLRLIVEICNFIQHLIEVNRYLFLWSLMKFTIFSHNCLKTFMIFPHSIHELILQNSTKGKTRTFHKN